MRDVVPRFVEPFRRRREGRLVVRLQLDRPAKSATTTLPALTGRRGGRFAFGDDVHLREGPNLASELHFVARDRALIADANVVAVNVERFDERNFIALNFAFRQLGFPFLVVDLRVCFAGQFSALLLQGVSIFLVTTL